MFFEPEHRDEAIAFYDGVAACGHAAVTFSFPQKYQSQARVSFLMGMLTAEGLAN